MIESWELLQTVLAESVVKLAVSLLCGILLGMERELKGKPAGLRTIALITVGATIFMIVSDLIALVTEGPTSITRVDPSRIASQVVTGIGFLGAGAIIQARGAIHGLTTAATIWVAASIGLCVGVGFPLLGIAVTVLVLLVLIALIPVRAWLSRRGEEETLTLVLPNDALALRRVKNILRQNGVPDRGIALGPEKDDTLMIELTYRSHAGQQRLLEELSSVEGVHGEVVSS